MNVFTSGQSHQSWVWQVTALCFVLGVLLMGSLRTVSEVKRSGSGAIRVGVPPGGGVRPEMVRKLEKEIADLRESKTTLENTLAKGNDQVKALNDELQKVKVLAGLTPVTGAGIVLTLEDSKRGPPTNRAFEQDKYIIHDYDLQQAVHELVIEYRQAAELQERREVDRISFIQPVTVETSEGETCRVLTKDISASGIRLLGSRGFLGQKLRVTVPSVEGPNRTFVVRILWTCMVGDDLYENGGSFVELVG